MTIILTIVIGILILYILTKKNNISYVQDYASINIKDLKNCPEWLNNFDEITIKRITKITTDKDFNDKSYTYTVVLTKYNYDNDDDYHD